MRANVGPEQAVRALFINIGGRDLLRSFHAGTALPLVPAYKTRRKSLAVSKEYLRLMTHDLNLKKTVGAHVKDAFSAVTMS